MSKVFQMSLALRLGAIAALPLVAAATLLFVRTGMAEVPAPAAVRATEAGRWLGVIGILYVANFALAWKYATSWAVHLGRSLVWAVVAFLCIDKLVYLFGENQALAWQIIGLSDSGQTGEIAVLKSTFWSFSICLVAAVLCLAISFEKDKNRFSTTSNA